MTTIRTNRAIARCVRVALLAAVLGTVPAATRADGPPVLVAIATGPALESATAGMRAAADAASPAATVEGIDDAGTAEGLDAAVAKAKARRALGLVVAPSGAQHEALWRELKSVRVPVFAITSLGPDLLRNAGVLRHLAPTPVGQAIVAADAMLAPLAARRVAVVHEASGLGRDLAAGFARNLSPRVVLAGAVEWAGDGARAVDALRGFEPDWIYVALRGAEAEAFAGALGASPLRARCLFADGNRSPRTVAAAPEAAREWVFLDGPDPEVQGREGERLANALEPAGVPVDAIAVRAFEAARRILAAADHAGSLRPAKVVESLDDDLGVGAMGPLLFEPTGAIRFFPYAYWRLRGGRLETWPDGLLPTPGCGPPLGSREATPGALNDRGRTGFLTYGEGEVRTIEADLLALGLQTGGRDPETDRFCRDEVLRRAIRIAHRLFRREADGTPVPGWSWGMTFSTTKPSDDVPRSKVWLGIVAGDDPAAGGRVIGSGMAAIYSTFLKRTMYESRKLETPIGPDDRPLLDGTYRWGEDRARNLRTDEIRCLLDGFASAVGMTLAHEFGHLCGCGHDTEAPTSIMNVVAGAGAAWEDAVWIPLHQKALTTTLGIEGEAR